MKFELIKKAHYSLQISHQLQNKEYELAKVEWMLSAQLLNMQIENLQKQVAYYRKARRREKIATFLKGAAVGLGTGIIFAL